MYILVMNSRHPFLQSPAPSFSVQPSNALFVLAAFASPIPVFFALLPEKCSIAYITDGQLKRQFYCSPCPGWPDQKTTPNHLSFRVFAILSFSVFSFLYFHLCKHIKKHTYKKYKRVFRSETGQCTFKPHCFLLGTKKSNSNRKTVNAV